MTLLLQNSSLHQLLDHHPLYLMYLNRVDRADLCLFKQLHGAAWDREVLTIMKKMTLVDSLHGLYSVIANHACLGLVHTRSGDPTERAQLKL